MEQRFWILRLQFVLLVLLKVSFMKGEAIPTPPAGTELEDEALQSQTTPNNSITRRPTLRPYQDFPGGTGVGSWQEIAMYPTKETRSGRTLSDTNAQSLASSSPTIYSSSTALYHLMIGMICLIITWRPST